MRQYLKLIEHHFGGSKVIRRWLVIAAAATLFGLSGCDFGGNENAMPFGQEHGHEAHEEGEHIDLEGDDAHEVSEHDAHEESEHGAHEDDTDGDDDHANAHEAVVTLTPAQVSELGIEVQAVDIGPVAGDVILPAEVRFSGNSLAHITPRVTGMVVEVFANEGDVVEVGDPLAVLDSRELADTAAEYLSAIERLELASADVTRSRELRERGVVSEQAYFDDRQAHASAEIDVRAGFQSLLALGFDSEAITQLAGDENAILTHYRLTAPIAGTVIERHAVLGEVIEVDDEEPSFVIADTSEVWVDIAVYPNVLDQVSLGATANVLNQAGHHVASGMVSFVAPHIDEQTRTGRARLIINNEVGTLRPGMFVSVEVIPTSESNRLRVPVSAVQTIEEERIVFVETEEGYEVREVRLGQASSTHVEVLDGLAVGERIVVQGAFALKAELMKEGFDDGHNH